MADFGKGAIIFSVTGEYPIAPEDAGKVRVIVSAEPDAEMLLDMLGLDE